MKSNETPTSQSGIVLEELQEELRRAREDEARYRRIAEDALEQTKRLRGLTMTLGDMSRSDTLSKRGFEEALQEILASGAKSLGVARASVWLFEGSTKLRCVALRAGGCVAASGEEVQQPQAPSYFSALSTAAVVAAHDTRDDRRTSELGEYLKRHGIGAMLDAPIRIFGDLVGVVCHEHTGGPRIWQDEEQAFAAALGDLVALALMTHRNQKSTLSAVASEAKYKALVESLPVVVYSFQPAAPLLDYISPQIEALSGVPPEQWLEAGGLMTWMDAIDPAHRFLVEERLQRGFLVGKVPEIEYRVRHQDGSWRWVCDTCQMIRNADGSPIAVQGILRDITERVRAQRGQQEAERRFQNLLNNKQLFAVTLDQEGKITFLNEALAALYQDEQELIGKDWFSLMLASESRQAARDILFPKDEQKMPSSCELSLRAGGARLVIRWALTPLYNEEGQRVGVACLGMDLTERLLAESKEMEQQKNEGLTRLAAGAAHDMNNILASMSVLLESMDDFIAEEGGASLVSSLKTGLTRASDFTRELLRFARRDTLAPEAIELDSWLEKTIPLVQMVLGVTVQFTSSLRAKGCVVWIDPTKLQQVLLNLAANARDAMPHGGRARLSSEEVLLDEASAAKLDGLSAGLYVRVLFRDSGVGMSPQAIARAFDPSFTTKGDRGTGLGLSICKSIVTQAKGRIQIESEEGSFTTFLIYLPQMPKEHTPR